MEITLAVVSIVVQVILAYVLALDVNDERSKTAWFSLAAIIVIVGLIVRNILIIYLEVK